MTVVRSRAGRWAFRIPEGAPYCHQSKILLNCHCHIPRPQMAVHARGTYCAQGFSAGLYVFSTVTKSVDEWRHKHAQVASDRMHSVLSFTNARQTRTSSILYMTQIELVFYRVGIRGRIHYEVFRYFIVGIHLLYLLGHLSVVSWGKFIRI